MLIRRARPVGPGTPQARNDRAVAPAQCIEVTHGRKPRADTAAAAGVHYRRGTGRGRWVGWGVLAHNLDRIAGRWPDG